MATVLVVGANATLGAQIARFLTARGHTVTTACDRYPRGTDTSVQVMITDTQIAEHVGLADVVVLADAANRVRLVEACVRAAKPIVDLASEQHQVAAYRDQVNGVSCVMGAGLMPAVAELLMNTTVNMMAGPVQAITAAYTFPDGHFPPASIRGSAGRRLAVAQTLINGGEQLRDGVWRSDPIGDVRTLVWFPRPVGPRQALAWPSVSRFAVSQALADVRNFTQYVVVGGWRTELLQALANLAKRPRFARALLSRAATPVGVKDHTSLRFACVVEVSSGSVFRRAWAYGRDPYHVSAALCARAVDDVLARVVPQPSSYLTADAAHEILDDLTETTGMRWSISDEIQLPAH